MKLVLLAVLVAAFAAVECGNTFIGTSVKKSMVYRHNAHFSSKAMKKRIEKFNFTMPSVLTNEGKTIQGILAYDLTHSGASANITQGGIGFNFVNLRLKSDRGKELNYDILIYA